MKGNGMISRVKFRDDYRTFKAGEEYIFRPGVNLLVGDQGCGKSSLLELITGGDIGQTKELRNSLLEIDVSPGTNYKFYDFEKMNMRTMSYFGDNMQLQLSSIFSSHGEANCLLLSAIATAKDMVIFFDEPDMALSIRSCYEFIRNMTEAANKRNVQFIMAVHNPTLIESAPEVLSLEHKMWMSPSAFIETQKQPRQDKPPINKPKRRSKK